MAAKFESSGLHCPRCKAWWGLMVGPLLFTEVGSQMYVVRDLVGIQCHCGHMHGKPIVPTPDDPCQDAKCEKCKKKSGELHRGFAKISASKGITLWVASITHIECRCGHDWEPKWDAGALRYHAIRLPRTARPLGNESQTLMARKAD